MVLTLFFLLDEDKIKRKGLSSPKRKNNVFLSWVTHSLLSLVLSGHSKRKNGRKGQLFIVGAIVIVISLFALTESLSRPAEFDPSAIQGQDIAMVYLNAIEILNKTSRVSANDERDDNLKHVLLFVKQELLLRQAVLNLNYTNPETLPLPANANFNTPSISLNKTETLE